MSNLSQFGGGGIKSIQRGTIAVTLTSGIGTNTATITAVTTSKSTIEFLGATVGSALGLPIGARVALTNGTTVTADAYGGNGTTGPIVTVGYQVVEYL